MRKILSEAKFQVFGVVVLSVDMGNFNRIMSNDTEFIAFILDCTTLVDESMESVQDTFLLRWNLQFGPWFCS